MKGFWYSSVKHLSLNPSALPRNFKGIPASFHERVVNRVILHEHYGCNWVPVLEDLLLLPEQFFKVDSRKLPIPFKEKSNEKGPRREQDLTERMQCLAVKGPWYRQLPWLAFSRKGAVWTLQVASQSAGKWKSQDSCAYQCAHP